MTVSALITHPGASGAKIVALKWGCALLASDPESFWTLLRSPGHWAFEIFLMVLFDIVLGGLAWPFLKKHLLHHLERDKKEGLK